MFTIFSDFSTQQSSEEFLASRGLWEENTHSNLCTYVIALSCWRWSHRGFRSVGSLAKTNIWSPQRARVWGAPREITSQRYPQSPCSALNCAAPGAGFWHNIVFVVCTFAGTLIQSSPSVPRSRSRFWSRPDPGRASWSLCSSSPAHVTNDRWRSCRGSAASLCLLRSRNTFASDAWSPETLRSAPTDYKNTTRRTHLMQGTDFFTAIKSMKK